MVRNHKAAFPKDEGEERPKRQEQATRYPQFLSTTHKHRPKIHQRTTKKGRVHAPTTLVRRIGERGRSIAQRAIEVPGVLR